jgi:hypothetical protein
MTYAIKHHPITSLPVVGQKTKSGGVVSTVNLSSDGKHGQLTIKWSDSPPSVGVAHRYFVLTD